MRRVTVLLAGPVAGVVLASTLGVGPAVGQGVPGPAADPFYRPPAALVEGPTGTVVHTRPATGPSVLPDAGAATTVIYRSTSIDGRPVAMSGTLLVPQGDPPADGWPLVTWSHMTTGAADVCAPSAAQETSSELDHMTQGDDVVARLLRSGVAVAKPDYEGIGTEGPHPYLIGDSLATSTADLASAVRRLDPRIGRRWVAAGQSEGGVAALFTAEAGRELPDNVDLVGVSAFVPPTRMDSLIRLFRPLPLPLGPELTGQLVGLAGLIIKGASTVDPELADLLPQGGLTARAWALWPHLEDRCFNDLTLSSSWGGLAPIAVAGPKGKQALDRLFVIIQDNDVRSLDLRPVPVRLDVGLLDVVVPITLSEELISTYRKRGVDLTVGRWLAGHSPVTDDRFAAAPAAAWITGTLTP